MLAVAAAIAGWTARGLGPYRRLDLALAALVLTALGVALARRWEVVVRAALLTVAAQYALSLPGLGSRLDGAAPLVAGGLVLAFELADMATSRVPVAVAAPGLRERHLAWMAARIALTVGVSTAALALAGAGGSEFAWQAAGVIALATLGVALAGLLGKLARE